MFSRQWDRTKPTPDLTQEEIQARCRLINLVRGSWDDRIQDLVFMDDSPTAAAALDLVVRLGVRRAGQLIISMNEENDDGD